MKGHARSLPFAVFGGLITVKGAKKSSCEASIAVLTASSTRSDSLKTRILNTTRDIVNLGVKNPEIIGLMGIFEDDVGPDTISDMTTNSLLGVLQEITLDFLREILCPDGKIHSWS